MNKQIARALVLKNFTEAKGLIFGSLYAKSSLAMDEARYEITKSMFNTPEESEEIIEGQTEYPERRYIVNKASVKPKNSPTRVGTPPPPHPDERLRVNAALRLKPATR